MAAYSCPKGHASSEADFCSECGAKITGAISANNGAGAASPALGPAPCPDCKAPRAHDSGDFCEVCGYNFATGAHGDVAFAQAAATAAPAPSSAPPSPPDAAAAAPITSVESAPAVPAARNWTIVAAIDPTLREEGSPDPPSGAGPYAFNIEKVENLIGRHSRARAIEPEIALDFDDAVSHRHAIIFRLDDGSLRVRDIGSANGTRLNGADLTQLTDAALKDGDELTLGHWTRLTVKASQ